MGIGLTAIVAVPLLMLVIAGAAFTSSDPSEPATPVPSEVVTTPVSEPPVSEPPVSEPPPSPTPPPPEPQPIPDVTYPPLPEPNSGEPAWATVQQAPLYATEFPDLSGCPAPALLETMAEFEAYTTANLKCIQDAWRPLQADLGMYSTEIPHYFYTGTTATSPCGTTEGAPAFYCSANGGSVYFGDVMLEATSYDPIWAKDTIGHEYGHHLQNSSGFFEAMYSLPEDNETVRRLEIQATCIGLGMMRVDDSIAWNADTYEFLEPHLRSVLEDGIHGSPDSLAYWGLRGFHGSTVGECNTWVVGSEGVS